MELIEQLTILFSFVSSEMRNTECRWNAKKNLSADSSVYSFIGVFLAWNQIAYNLKNKSQMIFLYMNLAVLIL